jgi:putative transposase
MSSTHTNLLFHIVYSTKYRRDGISIDTQQRLNETFHLTMPFAWQRGFGAFSVSASNVDQLRAYIRNQAQHHKTMSFRDEYRELLQRRGISFDEQYLFEQEHTL